MSLDNSAVLCFKYSLVTKHIAEDFRQKDVIKHRTMFLLFYYPDVSMVVELRTQ